MAEEKIVQEVPVVNIEQKPEQLKALWVGQRSNPRSRALYFQAENQEVPIPTPNELQQLLRSAGCDAEGIVNTLLNRGIQYNPALTKRTELGDDPFALPEDMVAHELRTKAVESIHAALSNYCNTASHVENIIDEKFSSDVKTNGSQRFETRKGGVQRAIEETFAIPERGANIAYQLACLADNVIRERCGLPIVNLRNPVRDDTRQPSL